MPLINLNLETKPPWPGYPTSHNVSTLPLIVTWLTSTVIYKFRFAHFKKKETRYQPHSSVIFVGYSIHSCSRFNPIILNWIHVENQDFAPHGLHHKNVASLSEGKSLLLTDCWCLPWLHICLTQNFVTWTREVLVRRRHAVAGKEPIRLFLGKW